MLVWIFFFTYIKNANFFSSKKTIKTQFWLNRLLGLTDSPPPTSKMYIRAHIIVSLETDAVFFRIDLSYLVSELWAFEVFDFIKGFGLRKILTGQICTKIFFGSFYRVSSETDATFFRIDLSLLVFELWAFEVCVFI